jgi:hypothetical protein
LNNRWIGCNKKTGSYHINSFKVIHRRTEIETKTGIVWDGYNFNDFTSFVYAAILLHISRCKHWYEKQKLKETGRDIANAGMKKGHSRKSTGFPSYPLPIKYASKKLNKSESFIVRMKNAAKCTGFLSIKNSLKLFAKENTNLKLTRKHYPEAHKLVIRDNKIFEQLPDKFTFYIFSKKKGNLKHN